MDEGDARRAAHDLTASVAGELSAVGFENPQLVGLGGFGSVFRCVQTSLGRSVAVKVLTVGMDEENTARFLREQKAMGSLTGVPNVVNIFDVGTTRQGRPYIVMQYYSGGSLDSRIRHSGPQSASETVRIGSKIAGALKDIHRSRIIHRDVKPSNVLFNERDEPVLADFGIAHIAEGFETRSGIVTGSPSYTAPEVLRGELPSSACDVYSLGATLFCAVTGHAAFERHTDEDVVAQFIRIAKEPISGALSVDVPAPLRAVIERAMALDVHARPSMLDLHRSLRLVASNSAPTISADATGSIARDARQYETGTSNRVRPMGGRSTSPRLIANHRRIPLELTSLVDRRTELTEAKKFLKTVRLLTLTGIGGVGKTRLALRLANDLGGSFTDGAWFIDLTELADEALLVNVVMQAVGLRETSSRALDETLVEYAAPRNLLLVLDNCEHVINAVAQLAELLLRTCGRVRILVTSRESLGIGGEWTMRIRPLTVPDEKHLPSVEGSGVYHSVALFIERARAIVSDFSLNEGNIHAVVGICQHLDGLPLSIEMAASRLRVMSPEQIGQKLEDRYRLLALANRSAPTRQQSLRLCIDWSYDLCSPVEQKAFTYFSVFSGSFEIDAAEGICGIGLDSDYLADIVTSLIDKSLLIREESESIVRFRMLDTLREYGRERATQTGEYETIAERHAVWYKKLASDAEAGWISPQQLGWIARLKREQANIREAIDHFIEDSNVDAALDMAGALFPYWLSQGQLTEGRQWLDRCLALRSIATTERLVKALFASIVLAGIQGDLVAGARRAEQARALVGDVPDQDADARIAVAEGGLALWSGDHIRARFRLEHALELLDAHEDFMLRLPALMLLGLALALDSDHEGSSVCHEAVLEITEPRGESAYRSYSLWATGINALRQGKFEEASERLKRALALASGIDDLVAIAGILEPLAWIASHEGDPKRAAVLMGAANSLGVSIDTSSVIYPELAIHHDEAVAASRGTLGVTLFEESYGRGKKLGVERAVAYAFKLRPVPATSRDHDSTKLTKREQQVAKLVAEGLTNKAIATRLVISQRTASGHVEHILSKLGFVSRAQIAAWVVEHQNRSESM